MISGLLMRGLRLVQHLSFSYSMGDFLTEYAPPLLITGSLLFRWEGFLRDCNHR